MSSFKFAVLLVALVSLVLVSPASADPITFDHRENLNLLNSPDVTITALYPTSNNSAGSELRGYAGETSSSGVGWFSVFNDTQKEMFTMDLGAVRNIETFRVTANSAGTLRRINTANVQTSSDGVNWSAPLTGSPLVGALYDHTAVGQESRFVLPSPVNTRYVRFTGESYTYDTGGSRQVAIQQLGVYGSAVTVTADKGLDLISFDGWTAGAGGGATITSTGSTQATWLSGMASDNEADSDNRQLVYDMHVGDTVTAKFNSTVTSIRRVGFGLHGASAKNMSYRFLGSTDGFANPLNTTVLLTHNGVTDPATWFGPQFFDLASPFTGNAIRFEVTNTGSGSVSYMDDLFAFQVEVPEPASLSVTGIFAAIGLTLRRRNLR
jgi:hypothetical protein